MQGRHVLGVAALVAVTLLTPGCDPCSGIAQCSTSAPNLYLAVDGQIVEAASGRGVDGVRIDVIRHGGVAVERDSLSTVTADGGHWRVQFAPATGGTLDAEAVITTPDSVSYRVQGLRFATSGRGGEANLLDRWVANPYFPNAGELFLRGTVDERVVGASVEFRRTAGLELSGPGVSNGVFRSTSDFAGRVPLFSLQGEGVFTSGVGEVVGNLIVRRSSSDSSVVSGLHIRSSYIYQDAPGIIRLGVGPSLQYQGEFFSRATGGLLGGVQVEFQRTGGVNVTAPNFTTTSQANGRFSFLTRPLTSGTLQGRLIFRAPIPSTPETLFVSLPTLDDDAGRFYGVIAAGAYMPYYGIVIAGSGVGLDGVKVDVKRVGGIAVSPDAFTTESMNGGIFRVQPAPQGLGEAIVDLTFRPPAPYPSFTVSGVRLATADRTVNDRLIGVFRADAPPAPSMDATTHALSAGPRAP